MIKVDEHAEDFEIVIPSPKFEEPEVVDEKGYRKEILAALYFISMLVLFTVVKFINFESFTLQLLSLLIGSFTLFDIYHSFKK